MHQTRLAYMEMCSATPAVVASAESDGIHLTESDAGFKCRYHAQYRQVSSC